MRCLYCGKQLAFLRRLTGAGDFCSEAHKQSYHDEYNRIALSRLMQAQSKTDEVRVTLPKPAAATQLVKTAHVHDDEPNWTTAPQKKRLSAPIETPAHQPSPIAAPPQANFIVTKPHLRLAARIEANPTAALHVYGNADVSHSGLTRLQTTGLLSVVTCNAGLPLADLIPLDTTPIPWNLAEREVESAIESEESQPFYQIPLQGYIPPKIRPLPPSKSLSPIPAGNAAPKLELTLPVNSPLPLRPKIATADPAALPEKKPSGTDSGKPGSDVDLPQFLQNKEPEPDDKSGKVWGNVQKYIKNLVGCFLIACLLGVAGWNFRSGAAAAAAQITSENKSGESDRTRSEHQLFVYPESLGLEDYRVEFEVPVTNNTIEWVFRSSDPRSCYVMRLEPDDSAGTKFQIRKYVVVNGEPIAGTSIRLLRPPVLKYVIKLEIRGSQFRTYSQGQLVDRWNDATYSRGGFGYYSRGGEPAPLQSVRFTKLAPMTRDPSGHDE